MKKENAFKVEPRSVFVGGGNTATPQQDYHQQQEPRREARSRRVNVLMRPSLYAMLADLAAQDQRSVNNFINLILEQGVKEYIDNDERTEQP